MIRSFAVIFLVGFSTILISQIPNSKIDLGTIDRYVLPAMDHDLLKNANRSNKMAALRFAEPRDVNISPLKTGSIQKSANDEIIWMQRIKSTGAHSINLGFEEFELPRSAKLWIYNIDRSELIGPFTFEDNDKHRQLWTPVLSGDELVLELHISKEDFIKEPFRLTRINHDFLDIKKSLQSGSCNVDVACGAADGFPIIDDYRDIITSVGAYTLNGIDACSGVLINNTAEDFRPFFLTANHCNISSVNDATMVVFWHYENSFCRTPNSNLSGQAGDGRRIDFNSGAELLANAGESDFALVELDDPIDPELNLFFAGWDLSTELPDTSICIHHPNVEEKRISFEFDPPEYIINQQSDSVRITVFDWDIGTTEPGSSGAPLFNTNKRMIGQLFGGYAACGNDEEDFFGWIGYSWDKKPGTDESLVSWLDPLGIGPEFLDGRSCCFELSLSQNYFELCGLDDNVITVELMASSFFDENVSYSILEVPAGLSTILQFESGSKSQVNTLTIEGFSNLEDGQHEIILSVSDGNNSSDSRIIFDISADFPPSPTLSEPADGAEDLTTDLELTVRRTTNVQNIFELALDIDFNMIAFSEETESRRLNINGLKSGETYYWRVRSINQCGQSEWSDIFSFATAPSFCTKLCAVDVPIEIQVTNPNIIESVINYPYPTFVQDVNILNVEGDHTFVGDLIFSLDFSNTVTELAGEFCFDNQNFLIGWDDDSENINILCPPTSGEVYKPKVPLNAYNSRLAAGEWKLVIEDIASIDGGQLNGWELEVCFSEALSNSLIPSRHKIEFCEDAKIYFNAYYRWDSNVDVEIRMFDRDENQIQTDNTFLLSSIPMVNISLDANDLTQEVNNIRLELFDKSNGEILAFAAMQFIRNGEGEQSNLIAPTQDEIIALENDFNFEWADVSAQEYVVQLSQDSNFNDLVFESQRLTENNLSLESSNFNVGRYYLRVISTFECGDIFSEVRTFVYDQESSDYELPLNAFLIYPNPGSDIINLKFTSSEMEPADFYLLDLNGRRIDLNLYQNGSLISANTSQIPTGVYILRWTDGKDIIDRKWVKI